MESPKRLIIATVLIALLVPMLFGFYSIIGEDSSAAILAKIIQVIPLGDSILKIVLLPISDSMSHYDTFSDWLNAQELSLPQHFTLEAGKLVFSSAILMLIEKIAIVKIKGNGGLLDTIADFLLVTLAVFVSCWLTDLLLTTLDLVALMDLNGKLQGAMTYIYSGMLGVGSVALIMLAGIVFVDAFLRVLLSCFKMIITYMGIICILAYHVQTESIILSVVVFLVWFSLIVGLCKTERGVI